MLDGVSHDTPSSKNEGRAPTNLFYVKKSLHFNKPKMAYSRDAFTRD